MFFAVSSLIYCFLRCLYDKKERVTVAAPFFVLWPCVSHRCVNYWKTVFFSRLLWDRLQELAVTGFLFLVKKKKFQTWGGSGNEQIDGGLGQWRRNKRKGPTQSNQKKGSFTASTFPAPIRVSSNYPCPVPSPKAGNFPEEMVLREQWAGTVQSSFSVTY